MSTNYKIKSIKDVQRESVRKANKRRAQIKLVSYAVLFVTGIVFIFSLFGSMMQKAYLLKVGTVKIGYVQDSKAAMALVEKAKQKIETEVGSEIKLVDESKPHTDGAAIANKVDSDEKIIAKLKDELAYEIKTYTINVDGVLFAAVSNAQEVNKVLNEIKNKYDTTKEEVDFVSDASNLQRWFKENIMIGKDYFSKKDILDAKAVLDKIKTGGTSLELYEIKPGDTLSKVAAEHSNLKTEDIIKMNPELKEKALKVGQKIKLGSSQTGVKISVITREQKTYEEKIPKKVTIKENDQKYKNERKVLQEGKDGKKKITANIIKVNGVTKDKEILSEEIIEEAREEIVEVGTKKLAAKAAMGAFAMPTTGMITSRFGEGRPGHSHKGVDIANDVGTSVYAAENGIISEVGYDAGGYGKYIKIRHSNGFETMYAHLSQVLVSEGKKIGKKDKIALMGNTGSSTGPHLHFELYKDGSLINPLKYVR